MNVPMIRRSKCVILIIYLAKNSTFVYFAHLIIELDRRLKINYRLSD